jgi:hypothetical protein
MRRNSSGVFSGAVLGLLGVPCIADYLGKRLGLAMMEPAARLVSALESVILLLFLIVYSIPAIDEKIVIGFVAFHIINHVYVFFANWRGR